MVDWEKIYLNNNKNNKKAGNTFEELALKYLSSMYSQYSWKSTKSSWDDNRDFISLVLDNIWGEAKYKKDSSALRKQDVDPTMLSGFLNGKIKLVFIITNGTIPQTINDRLNATGKKCGFKVVCITQKQLEYWLIAHPIEYKYFFNEELPKICPIKAISVEKVYINNNLELSFQSSYIEPEFVKDDIYDMNITFSCNSHIKATIIEKNDYPFIFLQKPETNLTPGILQVHYQIKFIRENNEPILIEFCISDGTILLYALDIKVVSNNNPIIVYSQQEYIKLNICNTLRNLPTDYSNYIIDIQGKDNFGKTFLMKELAKDLSFDYVVVSLQCMHPRFVGTNCMKLCQLIMYINYGDYYHSSEEYDTDTINYYKYFLIKNNLDNSISDNLILDIFDGCFDYIIAKNVISTLNNTINLIKSSHFARKHILLIDDVQYFNTQEQKVFNVILSQLKSSNNNSVIIFSYDKFDYQGTISYKLQGMLENDILESLKCNLSELQYVPFISFVKKMPKQPHLISELINFIKHNSQTNLSFNNINEYIRKIYETKFTSFKTTLTDEEKNIVDLIYYFPQGINEKLLNFSKISKNILDSLCQKEFILYINQRYIPCYDYFYYSYINQNEKNFNNYIATYLFLLLQNAHEDILFDKILAQALLFMNNKTLYFRLKNDFKNKIFEYIYAGDYRKAMIYGDVLCFDILNDQTDCADDCLEALFYYGISLIHCDSQRRAIDIFNYIKNNVSKKSNSLLYYKASSELLNNKYSRLLIENLIHEAIALKNDIHKSIKKIKNEDLLYSHQIRISYSTCMNRMMMIYFLLNEHEKAQEMYQAYCDYHITIPKCTYTNKYESMLLEWKMDFARGIGIENIQESNDLYVHCYKNFSDSIDNRRKILCQIDMIFSEAIIKQEYDDAIVQLGICKKELLLNGFVSEEFKAGIRIAYCQLMKYASIPEFSDNIQSLLIFVDEIYSELLSTQLEKHLISMGRTSYIVNNLITVLHIIKNDMSIAKELLEYNLKLTQKCGPNYIKIVEHNYKNLSNIKKVDWYFAYKIMDANTYYLDIRVW